MRGCPSRADGTAPTRQRPTPRPSWCARGRRAATCGLVSLAKRPWRHATACVCTLMAIPVLVHRNRRPHLRCRQTCVTAASSPRMWAAPAPSPLEICHVLLRAEASDHIRADDRAEGPLSPGTMANVLSPKRRRRIEGFSGLGPDQGLRPQELLPPIAQGHSRGSLQLGADDRSPHRRGGVQPRGQPCPGQAGSHCRAALADQRVTGGSTAVSAPQPELLGDNASLW